MKLIPLTQERFAQVDDEDFYKINQYKWYAEIGTRISYAARSAWNPETKKYRHLSMHAAILGIEYSGLIVDHKDHDGLNNTRSNLRISSHSENLRNLRSHKDSSSGFVGVSLCPVTGKWVAQIQINKKKSYIGRFNTEIEAAIMRDVFADKYFGEFAHLNVLTR